MITGNPVLFAIESKISEAFPQKGLMALGYYVIHVSGRTYGVAHPEATMLACSFDSVQKRINDQGLHKSLCSELSAVEVVRLYMTRYLEDDEKSDWFLNISTKFQLEIDSNSLLMAPDGDAAFDDCSHILQIDMNDKVRIIAFKNLANNTERLNSIQEIIIDAGFFYGVLNKWIADFSEERQKLLSRNTSVN